MRHLRLGVGTSQDLNFELGSWQHLLKVVFTVTASGSGAG